MLKVRLMFDRSFYGQCPFTLLALVLAWLWLPQSRSEEELEDSPKRSDQKGLFEKLRRVDFLGAITVILMTLSFLLALEIGSKTMVWVSPLTISLLISFPVLACAFIYIEKYWAKEPVFPVHLMRHRDIVTTYPVGVFQSIAQMGVSVDRNSDLC